jgi:hypothetical protein
MQQIEMPKTIDFYQGGEWKTMPVLQYQNRAHNQKTSEQEVEEWKANPPDKYFLYIKEVPIVVDGVRLAHSIGTATTWMGDLLGRVYFGREYRSNFGDKRVPVTVYGNNGARYHGTYYKSAGDYARVRRYK